MLTTDTRALFKRALRADGRTIAQVAAEIGTSKNSLSRAISTLSAQTVAAWEALGYDLEIVPVPVSLRREEAKR